MTFDTVYVYCDASFRKSHHIAVIGYAFICGTHAHQLTLISEAQIHLHQIDEVNNIRAEIRGAISALRACPKAQQLVLFSDCQTLCNLPIRRTKLESSNFMSQAKNRPLANEDLYKEFYTLYDLLQPKIIWIKGHSPAHNLSQNQKNFSILDQKVRRSLKKLLPST